MDNFSISELARFSGVKAHTIRMWEQRYHALKPKRTEGNTRYYDNGQLRRLLNIVSLAGLDYKISDLCMLPDKKLLQLVQQSNTDSAGKSYEYFIAHLTSAGMSYDEPGFEKIFSHCITRYGMKQAYLNIIYPLLVRVGFMWSADTIPPAHEHFISNLLRQKLFTAIDSLPLPKAGCDEWLLFLPENEFHEIGLLFASYFLRLSGKKVIYLGTNVPFESLKEVVKEANPRNLLLFLVHENLPEVVQQYLDVLSKQFKDKNVFVAGHENLTGQLKKGSNIHFLHSVADLEQQALPAPELRYN